MCPSFLTVSHKYAISFDNDVLISSADIPAELHVVVWDAHLPDPLSFFPSLIFRRGVVAESLVTRLEPHRVRSPHPQRRSVELLDSAFRLSFFMFFNCLSPMAVSQQPELPGKLGY